MALSNFPARVLVTGGAGFVGSATIRQLLLSPECQVLSFDKLTYAADRTSIERFNSYENYQFLQADICDRQAIGQCLKSFQPDAILHAAAETHVDRSISDAADFVQTNLVGTYTLLESIREYWQTLDGDRRDTFRFLHVSTDEVYGSLGTEGQFLETSPYCPRSPYSATKAGGDHLGLAWYHTYGLPVMLTHCSNNFGPYQFPEKLIPRMIINAISEQPLPVYGKGENVRDWLYVDDHAKALCLILRMGQPGHTYNIGGNNERTNLEVVLAVCQILNELRPLTSGVYADLITFVSDRPGHDRRYAVDSTKVSEELGWRAEMQFDRGLHETVEWYLANIDWWKPHGYSCHFDK